jgi:beta-lactamase superfamily II metal-dependent hydrolase
MDHLDGLKYFFEKYQPVNFWDTDNNAKKEFGEGSPYNENDWKFYKRLRDSNPQTNPKRLTLFSGSWGQFYNRGEDGNGGGDGLYILAPTPDLVEQSNQSEGWNDCSYVILYRMSNGKRVLFAGDCQDTTWDHILNFHRDDIEDIDLLIAPHHGRKSSSYDFLNVMSPKMTFFGNARSEHLGYDAWHYRDLRFITNNQAGCMVVNGEDMSLYVTHEPFAKEFNPYTFYSPEFQAYRVCQIA